jgi:hypothetical protein
MALASTIVVSVNFFTEVLDVYLLKTRRLYMIHRPARLGVIDRDQAALFVANFLDNNSIRSALGTTAIQPFSALSVLFPNAIHLSPTGPGYL